LLSDSDFEDVPVAHRIVVAVRERDCVTLLGAGLTDGEIGRRLALSEETVTKYLNAARRRNGFARRSQLIVAALRDGEIAADPEPPELTEQRVSDEDGA
jgi:DNA-binding CsgD family transcriptional regulator